MLRKILLITISIINYNAFAKTFVVKYEDYIKRNIVTEFFINSDDFANRLSELQYINNDSIKIMSTGLIKDSVSHSKSNQTVIEIARMGGEGMGN